MDVEALEQAALAATAAASSTDAIEAVRVEYLGRKSELKLAHLAERELQLALAPHILDPNGFDRVRRRRGGDRREGRLLERLDVHGRIEASK